MNPGTPKAAVALVAAIVGVKIPAMALAAEPTVGPASPSVAGFGLSDAVPYLAAGLSLGTPIAIAAIAQPQILNIGISYPLATLGAGSGQLLAGDPVRALAVSVGGAAVVASSLLAGMLWDEVAIPKEELRPRKWTGLILVTLSWPVYSAWAAWDAFSISSRKLEAMNAHHPDQESGGP